MAKNMIFPELSNPTKILTPIQSKLIRMLDDRGPMSRRELVKMIEKPRTTVYDNLAKLEKRKMVERLLRKNGERGRPLTIWKLKE